PRGPVLPAERHFDPADAVAGAPGGRPAAGRALPARAEAFGPPDPRGPGGAGALRLARKRPRAAERRRARRGDERGLRDRPRRPAPGSPALRRAAGRFLPRPGGG